MVVFRKTQISCLFWSHLHQNDIIPRISPGRWIILVFLGKEVSRVRWLSIARVFECVCVCVCLCKMASLVRSAPSALWFLRPSRCPYAELKLSHTPTWTPLLRLTHTQDSWHQSLTAADCMNAVLYPVTVLLKWRETSVGVNKCFWL